MTKKQANVENQAINLLSKEELSGRMEVVEKELRSYTWRELETNGKFAKNGKRSFIADDMLIAGCDTGSETHYVRAIDVRGREVSRGAFEFSDTAEGFENAKAWVLALAAENKKTQIAMGFEPTGHCWFALAAWMISNGISVVQVNPHAVKRSKEIEDSGQLKDDRNDIAALGAEGVKNIWRDAKLRGRGYSRARGIVGCAEKSVGLTDGTDAGREAVEWFAEQILKREERLAEIEGALRKKCKETPYAENMLEINGAGENIPAGMLAEMGDVSRFDDVKEIQKLSGMGLASCSSGKRKGRTKISRRGRKRLRCWLFQAAKSAVSHADEFKQLHERCATRANNPLKKMQSLLVIACKMLRVIYAILKTGAMYDPQKMLKDIKRPEAVQAQTAA